MLAIVDHVAIGCSLLVSRVPNLWLVKLMKVLNMWCWLVNLLLWNFKMWFWPVLRLLVDG